MDPKTVIETLIELKARGPLRWAAIDLLLDEISTSSELQEQDRAELLRLLADWEETVETIWTKLMSFEEIQKEWARIFVEMANDRRNSDWSYKF